MTIFELEHNGRTGIKLVFTAQGPGIPDIDRAMEDGYSTAKSMGLGGTSSDQPIWRCR